jgi:hypothetical protein
MVVNVSIGAAMFKLTTLVGRLSMGKMSVGGDKAKKGGKYFTVCCAD